MTNFMCVSRLRPKDPDHEADGNSDDLVSDEELFLKPGDLAEVPPSSRAAAEAAAA